MVEVWSLKVWESAEKVDLRGSEEARGPGPLGALGPGPLGARAPPRSPHKDRTRTAQGPHKVHSRPMQGPHKVASPGWPKDVLD